MPEMAVILKFMLSEAHNAQIMRLSDRSPTLVKGGPLLAY